MKKEYPELDMNHISFQDYVRSVFLCEPGFCEETWRSMSISQFFAIHSAFESHPFRENGAA